MLVEKDLRKDLKNQKISIFPTQQDVVLRKEPPAINTFCFFVYLSFFAIETGKAIVSSS